MILETDLSKGNVCHDHETYVVVFGYLESCSQKKNDGGVWLIRKKREKKEVIPEQGLTIELCSWIVWPEKHFAEYWLSHLTNNLMTTLHLFLLWFAAAALFLAIIISNRPMNHITSLAYTVHILLQRHPHRLHLSPSLSLSLCHSYSELVCRQFSYLGPKYNHFFFNFTTCLVTISTNF